MVKFEKISIWLTIVNGAGLIILAVWAGQFLQQDTQGILISLRGSTGLSILVIAAFFALKALTCVIIPSAGVYLLGGLILPLSLAVPVIVLGMASEFIINYHMGSWGGKRLLGRFTLWLKRKYEIVSRLLAKKHKHQALTIFLLRLLPGPPNNVTSLFLGAAAVPFRRFLWSSMLGALPKALLFILSGSFVLQQPINMNYVMPASLLAGAAAILIFWYWHQHSLHSNDEKVKLVHEQPMVNLEQTAEMETQEK